MPFYLVETFTEYPNYNTNFSTNKD